MKFTPYEYQQTAIQWILDKPRSCLFLDMGLGKTVSTLTAVQTLIDCCDIDRVLVVAPKKVAETTWTTEADKWDHLSRLRVAKVMGSAAQRRNALTSPSDVYVINRDNFVWLVGEYNGRLPFDMIVIDELTSFKSNQSKRFKAMRMASASVSRVIGLTGTPAPNGYKDLWAQMYCIDLGERLGKSITRYRETYFNIFRHNGVMIRCDIKKGCARIIDDKIKDICLTMQAKDYLQLPDMITHTVRIDLSDEARKIYDDFERDRVMEFANESQGKSANVVAVSAAALLNKLSQCANGAVYDEYRGVHVLHQEKIERLVDIVEAACGNSVLVFYQYKHDIDRIREALKGYRVETYDGEQQLHDWNVGEIDVLLAHPASTAYGLNMQHGGHYIVWFGTGWNLELYQQANARLHRQGQQHPVIVYKLICSGTVDEQANAALELKRGTQQSLLDNLDYLTSKWQRNVGG